MPTLRSLVTAAIVLIAGCGERDGSPSDDFYSGNIAFSVSSDDVIYFTSPGGCLAKTTKLGETQILARPHHGLFSYVESSPDGRLVAIVRSPKKIGGEPEILLLSLNERGDVTELARTYGTIPCFRHSSESLFFCRPSRYVQQSGFGGGFWTDYRIFLWNWENDVVTEYSSKIFDRVDDLAWDDARGELLLSVSLSRPDGTVYEDIVKMGENGDMDVFEGDCKKANICRGDPDISKTRDKLVYISDKRQPSYYDLLVADRQLGTEGRLGGTEGYRFFKYPKFDGEGDGIYALAASDFTIDGQPVLQLIYFRNGKAKVVLSPQDLAACDRTKVSGISNDENVSDPETTD